MSPRPFLRRIRSLARRCAVGATYGCGVALACSYAVSSVLVMAATTLVAGVCWLLSGE